MTVIILFAVIAAIILLTAWWKIHPLPVLLDGAFIFGVTQGHGVTGTIALISGGFGDTVKSIGIVIITGTVIGVFMEKRVAPRYLCCTEWLFCSFGYQEQLSPMRYLQTAYFDCNDWSPEPMPLLLLWQ